MAKKYIVSEKDIKKWKLDKEEIDILEAVERGDFASVKNEKEEIKKFKEVANYTLNGQGDGVEQF